MDIDKLNPILLSVGKAEHNADWNWDSVCSPFARIYYIVEGSAQLLIDDTTLSLEPGCIYVVPPFVTHTTRCNSRFVHYYIHLYEEYMSGNWSFNKYELPYRVPSFQSDKAYFERLIEINPHMSLAESNPDTYDNRHTLMQSVRNNKMRSDSLRMESRGLLYIILSHYLAQATPKEQSIDPRIDDSLTYITDHLTDRLTVEQLASLSCVTPEYYIRLFRRYLYTTPMDYINNKRMERAQLLLLTTDTSVKTLSSQLGYTDPCYFNRVFKRTTGMTPRQYRSENEKR